MQDIDCLMLAAGCSSRMGDWKMMLPYEGSTIIDTAINNALGFCHRVVLVTGHRGSELRARYQNNTRIFLVHNPDYLQGMFSSVQAGVKHVRGDHVFMALGDMPCIKPWVYSALWHERGEFTLIPRCYQGKGHPVLLPANILSEVMRSDTEHSSMKAIIQKGECRFLDVGDMAIHCDIDTPGEYRELLRSTSE